MDNKFAELINWLIIFGRIKVSEIHPVKNDEEYVELDLPAHTGLGDSVIPEFYNSLLVYPNASYTIISKKIQGESKFNN